MTMTREEMRVALSREEPDYAELVRQLDRSDIPLLRAFAMSDDPMLSTKAVYLASLMGADEAADIVDVASRSSDELVRIAAASALPNLPVDRRNEIALSLLDDTSQDVKKLTLIAAERPSAALQSKIQAIANETRFAHIRSLAQERLKPQD